MSAVNTKRIYDEIDLLEEQMSREVLKEFNTKLDSRPGGVTSFL